MTPIDWATRLPCLRWEPYGVAPRPGSLEETLGMVTNLSRVYTQNNEVVTCDVVLNATDEPTFRTFYKTTLAMGTQWFNGDILRNGVYESYELCFIGAPPVFTPIAQNVVKASFTLLLRGLPAPPGPPPPLACPGLSIPIDGSAVGEVTSTTLLWTAVTGASTYRVYVWEDGDPQPGSPTTTTADLTYEATGLSIGVTYRWTVDAVSSGGSVSEGCESATFSMEEGEATIQWQSATFTGDILGASVTLVAVRTGDASGTASADYDFTEGTALIGPDFIATPGTVEFDVGEVTKNVVVPLVRDYDAEVLAQTTVVPEDPPGPFGFEATRGVGYPGLFKAVGDTGFNWAFWDDGAPVNPANQLVRYDKDWTNQTVIFAGHGGLTNNDLVLGATRVYAIQWIDTDNLFGGGLITSASRTTGASAASTDTDDFRPSSAAYCDGSLWLVGTHATPGALNLEQRHPETLSLIDSFAVSGSQIRADGDTALYVLHGVNIKRIDPANGAEVWSTALADSTGAGRDYGRLVVTGGFIYVLYESGGSAFVAKVNTSGGIVSTLNIGAYTTNPPMQAVSDMLIVAVYRISGIYQTYNLVYVDLASFTVLFTSPDAPCGVGVDVEVTGVIDDDTLVIAAFEASAEQSGQFETWARGGGNLSPQVLSAYWNFAESSPATTFSDLTGNGLDLILSNTTNWTYDQPDINLSADGTVARSSGSANYLCRVNINSLIDNGDSFTIADWYDFNVQAVASPRTMFHIGGAGGSGQFTYCWCYRDTAGKLAMSWHHHTTGGNTFLTRQFALDIPEDEPLWIEAGFDYGGSRAFARINDGAYVYVTWGFTDSPNALDHTAGRITYLGVAGRLISGSPSPPNANFGQVEFYADAVISPDRWLRWNLDASLTFTATLSNPVGAVLGAIDETTMTIEPP